jgi:anti-sigma factor RsiW
MSNERNINELLSAYFDGEVTAEEHARVEQFLEESVEARCELDQFGSLSGSLKSLPGEPAPPELLPSVIRRAERETLLAIGGRARASFSGRKLWLPVVAGIVVTAASVMLMMQLLPDHTGDINQTIANNESYSQQAADRESVVAHSADDSPAPAAAVSADGVSSESPERAIGFGRDKAAEMNDPKASPVASPGGSGPVPAKLDGSQKLKSVAASGRESSKRGARKLAGSDAPSAERVASLNAQALKRARRGDVRQYFDSSGTKVTTYLVTVVDVKQAMNKLQLLLARHDISPQQPLASNDKETTNLYSNTPVDNKQTDKTAKFADEADEKTDRLFAIYIETTPGRYASALKALLNEELFADLSPETVDEVQIQVADLGRSYRSLFPQLGNEAKMANRASGTADSTAKNNARLTAKTPIPRNTPSPIFAQSLARKDSPTVKKKAKSDRAKSSLASKAESAAKPSGSGRAEKSESDRLQTDGFRIAARKLSEPRSFQLEVQLAPRDANLERQRSSARIDRFRSRNQTRQAASPAKNQAVAGAGVEESVVAGDRLSAVRVLFVFREAPRQTPQR